MYENLVKRLRRMLDWELIDYDANFKFADETIAEAADAIEELQQTAEHYKGCADDWYREACDYKAMIPRWIPVTERLPKNDDFVIVTVKDESGDSPYVYSDFGWYFDRAECWIVETEQRTNITHWMPLPKPPKEGET